MQPATLSSARAVVLRAAPRRAASTGAVRGTAPRRAGRAALSVCAAGKSYKITLLPGDGIGPEIMKVAVDCLNVVVRGGLARRRRGRAGGRCAGRNPFWLRVAASGSSRHAAPRRAAAAASHAAPPGARVCACTRAAPHPGALPVAVAAQLPRRVSRQLCDSAHTCRALFLMRPLRTHHARTAPRRAVQEGGLQPHLHGGAHRRRRA
jgi:hypothetical protein